jgi:hypothetical protein
MNEDEDNLETHFVENPFIKMRERASMKDRESKVLLGQGELEEDSKINKEQDLYIMKESGKMVVNDFEKEA